MGDDYPPLAVRAFEQLRIALTDQPFLGGRAHVAAASSEAVDDCWRDVLVCKEGKIERFHTDVLSSHTCSPLSTSAAYRKAAARPSRVSWEY